MDFRLGLANTVACPAGNEGSGLSQEVLASCQLLLTILPRRQLPPGLESLNVSVATGESTSPSCPAPWWWLLSPLIFGLIYPEQAAPSMPHLFVKTGVCPACVLSPSISPLPLGILLHSICSQKKGFSAQTEKGQLPQDT